MGADNATRIEQMEAVLIAAQIEFKTERHTPAKTVDDMMKAIGHLPGGKCKNLFVKAKKKSKSIENDTGIWLIVAMYDTDINLGKLSKAMGYKKALRLAQENRLKSILGVKQ